MPTTARRQRALRHGWRRWLPWRMARRQSRGPARTAARRAWQRPTRPPTGAMRWRWRARRGAAAGLEGWADLKDARPPGVGAGWGHVLARLQNAQIRRAAGIGAFDAVAGAPGQSDPSAP